MDIIELKLDELIPYDNNPRKNDEAVDKVALSISSFGFKVPIVIDRNNVIIAGHTRLKAAKKLGLTTVPVIRADDLTDDQVRAFRLADNKVGEFAGWDFEKLEQELGEIGIDMELFGFTNEDYDIDAFFTPSPTKGNADETEPRMIQCPHCGEWFEAEPENKHREHGDVSDREHHGHLHLRPHQAENE